MESSSVARRRLRLTESAPLLLTPGRRCENGKPAPVDRADWQQAVQGLVDAGRAAYKASQTRDQATVGEVTNVISDACANCHRVYRDVPTNAGRCTPPRRGTRCSAWPQVRRAEKRSRRLDDYRFVSDDACGYAAPSAVLCRSV